MDPCHAPEVSRDANSGDRPGLLGSALPRIALAGNPNTGKTSLFNRLTGSHARVGNYPGVTVELLSGRAHLKGIGDVEVLDIPGCYSLVARSAEEQLAIDRLLGLDGQPPPHLGVVCVDATNLQRNLYLVLQMQELGLPLVVALTMMDEAEGMGLDPTALARRLQCPVVPVNPRSGEGLEALGEAMGATIMRPGSSARWRWEPGDALRGALDRVEAALPSSWPGSRALALWALMSVDATDGLGHIPASLRDVVLREPLAGEAIDDEAIRARYAWIDGQVGPLIRGAANRTITDRADRVLIHPVFGFMVFLGIMFVVFQSLFAWADPAITAIETLFGWMGRQAESLLPIGILSELIVNGVIAGVGSVVVFLPQILLLFFFIGIMEDSGYMARVAYLMDRIMKAMGLHGRAFVPMLSGFACAIPAIMATRTMERQRDRFLTMMVVPLMTCSARLPVYTLLIGALFPAATLMGFLPVQGALMIGMYLFSVLIALLAAFVLSKTVFKAPPIPLVLELPPYRLPRAIDVLRMMWRRTRFFLTEAGTVILVCTMILWALLSFPRDFSASKDYDALLAGTTDAGALARLEHERDGERLRQSYGGRIGRALEPVLEPLGFDWKVGIGLVGAFAAREVFVATMGVVYNVGTEVDEESTTLRERMRAELRADGRPVYSPLMGLSLMVFFALACQCMSTLAVVRRETKSWRWPIFLFVYMTGLAWTASFIVYQGGRALGF